MDGEVVTTGNVDIKSSSGRGINSLNISNRTVN